MEKQLSASTHERLSTPWPHAWLSKDGEGAPGALLARRTEEGMEADDLSVLAQRASSEGWGG